MFVLTDVDGNASVSCLEPVENLNVTPAPRKDYIVAEEVEETICPRYVLGNADHLCHTGGTHLSERPRVKTSYTIC